ncbi:VOC family protein [Glaciihabitans sp. UYNi722]|uniref:VOC family protein n=1 Tax=Glaciihabitans sp. UYNi722 TaxID=3156344 RepID=UPI00339A1788
MARRTVGDHPLIPKDGPVYFASIRIITDDLERLTSFYESVTRQPAQRATEDFAQIVTTSASLAIGSRRTVGMLGDGAPQPASNNSVIVEFRVDDVDAEFDNVRQQGADIVLEPTTMPWGNRSLLFRDPDGNLVNFFAPTAPSA